MRSECCLTSLRQRHASRSTHTGVALNGRSGGRQTGPPFQRARNRGRHSLITRVPSPSLARLAPSLGFGDPCPHTQSPQRKVSADTLPPWCGRIRAPIASTRPRIASTRSSISPTRAPIAWREARDLVDETTYPVDKTRYPVARDRRSRETGPAISSTRRRIWSDEMSARVDEIGGRVDAIRARVDEVTRQVRAGGDREDGASARVGPMAAHVRPERVRVQSITVLVDSNVALEHALRAGVDRAHADESARSSPGSPK